jgi:ssDNA-binding Zn-finger/Zn-ribbon topoisomerase 1
MSKSAQERCDRERKKKPHLLFFVGDPPCPDCREWARKKRKEEAPPPPADGRE